MEIKWNLIDYTVCHVAHVDRLKLLCVVTAYANEARFDHQHYQSKDVGSKDNDLNDDPVERATSPLLQNRFIAQTLGLFV